MRYAKAIVLTAAAIGAAVWLTSCGGTAPAVSVTTGPAGSAVTVSVPQGSVPSDEACWVQASANAAGDLLTAGGVPAGAALAAVLSTVAGGSCVPKSS